MASLRLWKNGTKPHETPRKEESKRSLSGEDTANISSETDRRCLTKDVENKSFISLRIYP
jgi:hypothetical protein